MEACSLVLIQVALNKEQINLDIEDKESGG